MKPVFIILMFFSAITVSYAQRIKEEQVPAIVKQALNQKYPGVTSKEWTKEKDVFEAEVILNSKECEVAFNANGEWLETEREIKVSELPAAVNNTIRTGEYKTWTIKEAELIESPQYAKAYEVELKKNNEKVALLFSDDGNLIKTEKD